MRQRSRLILHIVLTMVAFATLGSAPRAEARRARDLPAPSATMMVTGEGDGSERTSRPLLRG